MILLLQKLKNSYRKKRGVNSVKSEEQVAMDWIIGGCFYFCLYYFLRFLFYRTRFAKRVLKMEKRVEELEKRLGISEPAPAVPEPKEPVQVGRLPGPPYDR